MNQSLGYAHIQPTTGKMWDAADRCWETDYQTGARYLYIHGSPGDKGSVARTVEVGKGVQIDYGADDQVLGIEFL